ncbi:MAG: hypothetical protein ACRD5L_02355, partial [Bryobacteraceae bacterium]
MVDFLTRIAERAMGVRPVAMPLLRPVFATPRKLESEDADRPSMTEAPRSNVSRAEAGAPPWEVPRLREERDSPREDAGQPRVPSMRDVERRAPAERPRAHAAQRPTLEEAIQRIYSGPDTQAMPTPSAFSKVSEPSEGARIRGAGKAQEKHEGQE